MTMLEFITAALPGTYEITFGGQWNSSDEKSFLALRVNEEIVSGSTLPAGGWRTLTLIVDAKSINTKFEVINNSMHTSESIQLNGNGDAIDNATTAFITIRKI